MASSQARWDDLQQLIDEIESSGATVGLSTIAPDGRRFSHNGSRRFGAASTVKLPLMIEIFRQIDRAERSLDERYILRAEDKAPGMGVVKYLHDGLLLHLADLLYLMISISDDTAANLLIDWTSMERVNATMRDLGMTGSTLERKMKRSPVLGAGPENWATPDDYALAVEAIINGRAASAGSCRRMTALLEQQQNPRCIARYLPADPAVRWGSKTGVGVGIVNDVGFIHSAAGTQILSVYIENLADIHLGEQAIGELSRAAMLATGLVEPLRVVERCDWTRARSNR